MTKCHFVSFPGPNLWVYQCGEEYGAVNLYDAILWTKQLLTVLHYLHTHQPTPIVHHDVKRKLTVDFVL